MNRKLIFLAHVAISTTLFASSGLRAMDDREVDLICPEFLAYEGLPDLITLCDKFFAGRDIARRDIPRRDVVQAIVISDEPSIFEPIEPSELSLSHISYKKMLDRQAYRNDMPYNRPSKDLPCSAEYSGASIESDHRVTLNFGPRQKLNCQTPNAIFLSPSISPAAPRKPYECTIPGCPASFFRTSDRTKHVNFHKKMLAAQELQGKNIFADQR